MVIAMSSECVVGRTAADITMTGSRESRQGEQVVIWVVKERVWVSSKDGGEEAGRGGC